MSPTKTKTGGPNYKGLYQETQKTLAKEREKIVILNTALRHTDKDNDRLLSDNIRLVNDMHNTALRDMELIKENNTMFKYIGSMAIITILTLIWGLLL